MPARKDLPAEYPRKVAIRRAIAAARENGMEIGAIELLPDGTIRILKAHLEESGRDLFAQLEAAGKI